MKIGLCHSARTCLIVVPKKQHIYIRRLRSRGWAQPWDVCQSCGRRAKEQFAMNILIVEDNPVIAMDLSWILEDLGHRVCGTADTAAKGIDECAHSRPDVVMVDLNLADGRTGLALVNTLAQLRIPSVIVSGETDTLPKTTWAKAVVSKPFHQALIARALADVEADFQQHVVVDLSPESRPGTGKVGRLRGLLWPWHK
jgi:CheY-like chemotaxis protein